MEDGKRRKVDEPSSELAEHREKVLLRSDLFSLYGVLQQIRNVYTSHRVALHRADVVVAVVSVTCLRRCLSFLFMLGHKQLTILNTLLNPPTIKVWEEITLYYADKSSYVGLLSQRAHALQCARQADEAGASDEVVVGSLLHDVGM